MSADSRETVSPHEARIVVTGLGVVSPLGSGIEPFWRRLMTASRSNELATGVFVPGVAAEFSGHVDDFVALPSAARKQLAKSLKVMNRETQLGVAAGLQALQDCGLMAAYAPERVGIAFGAGNACVAPEDFRAGVEACRDGRGDVDLSEWGARGMPEMAPLWILRCLPNMAACYLAILANIQGPSNTITQHNLGFDLALAEACRVLRSGDADAMLVGGSGTTLSGLHRLHAVWEEEAASPSTADSTSALSPAEGAAALVLETLSVARQRGAHVYGEVLACSARTRGWSPTAESPLCAAAREALERSQLTWNEIGHIHLPDLAAADRIAEALSSQTGTDHSALATIPTVAGRMRWGDAGAGSSAIDLAASLLALERRELFAAPSLDSRPTGLGLRLVTAGGEAAGENCLKFSRFGDRQATCVALARIPA